MLPDKVMTRLLQFEVMERFFRIFPESLIIRILVGLAEKCKDLGTWNDFLGTVLNHGPAFRAVFTVHTPSRGDS